MSHTRHSGGAGGGRLSTPSGRVSASLPTKRGSASAFHTSLYIVKICTGAGLLGLPYAFQESGLIAGVLIVAFVSFLNAASCRLLIHCANALASSPTLSLPSSPSSPPSSDPFARLAYVTLGAWGVHVVHLSIVLTLCGAVSIYVITISTLAAPLLPSLPTPLLLLLLFLVLLPFSLIRDLSFLSFASLLGTLSYLLSFTLIFAYGLSTSTPSLPASSLIPHSSLSLLTTIGTLSFTLGVPVLTFAISDSMQQPHLFTRTMDLTMAIIALTFSLIGTCGVALFAHTQPHYNHDRHTHHHTSHASPSLHHYSMREGGGVGARGEEQGGWVGAVQPIILSNLPPTSALSLITQVLISITLLLTAPLSLAPALNLLESVLLPPPPSSSSPSPTDPESVALLSPSSHTTPHLYGGLAAHDPSHELYNHSSDDEEEEEEQVTTPLRKTGEEGGGRGRGSIVVKGRVKSMQSLDALSASPLTVSASPSPARVASPVGNGRVVGALGVQAGGRGVSRVMANGLRVVVLVCVFVVAWTVPCFTLVMSCIGLFTLSILCFVLPPVFYLRLRQLTDKEDEGGRATDPRWWAVYAWLFLATGVFCMVAGGVVVSQMKCE